jgi:phosphohistidine phosphatase
MQLFVVRHAIAEDPRPGDDDAARQLTAEGERGLRRVVLGVRELGWRFERVLTSPWTRAARTAQLLAPVSDGKPVETELLCRAPSSELLAQLAEVPTTPHKRRGTAVVGHEPWLTELIGWLMLGDPHAGRALTLKKAGIAWLDGTAAPGGMKLRALLTPRLTRAMR